MAIRNLSNLLIKAISIVIFAIGLLWINAGLAEAATVLYYGQSYSPFEMRYTYSAQVKTVFTTANGTIKPVALDTSHGKLYFADPLAGIIYQSNLTGSAPGPYLSGVYAEGLAIDAANSYFYYTQSHTDASNIEHYNVVRANLANPVNSPTILYTTATGTPEAITVAENGDVYFSDPHETVATIYKVANGTSNPVAFMTAVHAYGLAVQGEYLYFSEAYDPNFKICKVKLSDKSVDDVDDSVYVSSTGAPKAMTIAGSDLYFADLHSSVAKIYKINLVSKDESIELSNVNAGGIAVFINTPPLVSVNKGLSTNENTPAVISNTELQTTDTETTDPGALVYKLLTLPGKGKLTKNGTEIAVNAEFSQSDINSGMIRYVPNPTKNGNDSFTFNVNDGMGEYTSGTSTFNITISTANSAPTFIKGANQTILEDAGPQTIAGWATGISTGSADESGQTYAFSCSNNNNSLFDVQPQLSHDGTLTYTPKANAYGIATVEVTITDNGGIENGGADHSTQSFTITITGINEAPSFTVGANQTVPENAGPQTITGWASGISAGPMENDQTLAFSVSNDNNSLFSAQPAVLANGTLTYTASANIHGSATVTVNLQDNGGTANGGIDTSSSQQFTITVTFQPVSSDATLKATSTVKGQPVTSLGTPHANLASAAAGTVTITTAQAEDITGVSPYVTHFEKNSAAATITKVVKYASGADTSGFEAATAYANAAISNNDFFIIKVTAVDASVLYYKIAVTVTNTLPPAPTVSSVSVDPAAVSVQKGTTRQFSALVIGTNNPIQTVTWAVYGGTGGTSINTTGLLTIAAGETAAALTVTATSAVDTAKSGTATVTVTNTPPPAPTVTSVSVDPTAVLVQKGTTRQFSALVIGTNNPAQTVTWAVYGAMGVTSINTTGLLTIAAGETAASLTVTATSTVDTGKSGTAAVTLTSASTSGGSGNNDSSNAVTKTDLMKNTDSNTTVTLTTAELNTARSLTVKGHGANLVFSQDLLAEMKITSSLAVTLKPVNSAELSAAARAIIGNRPVFNIKVIADGKTVTSIGTLRIEIPYTPPAGEDTSQLAAFYIADDGTITQMADSKYDSAKKAIVFTTSHLSVYAVGLITDPALTEPDDKDKTIKKFTDVVSGSWAESAIYYLANRNIVTGKTEITFAPNDNITRAEFVTILAKASGNTLSQSKDEFSDVAATAWYAPYVAWASQKGIARGYEGHFNPNACISRQDMVVMLVNYADKVGKYTLPASNDAIVFADDSAMSSYASKAVYAMQQAGIISGRGNNTFAPTANATRAEAAQMLAVLLQKK